MNAFFSVILSFMFLVYGQTTREDSLLVQGGIEYFNKFPSQELVDKKRIYAYNPTTEKENLLYEGKAIVKRISVSPVGRLIGFLEGEKLVILNSKGKVIHKVSGNNKEEIKKYRWNPEGNKIVFISYVKRDPDYPYRYPTGLWIFNLNTGEKTKIEDRADEIYWASHDNNIYFIDYREGREKVYTWDSETGKIELTPHKDIYFSPDGKYYLRLWKNEIEPIQLYKTSSDRKIFTIKARKKLIPEGYKVEIKPLPRDLGRLCESGDLEPPHGWVFNQGHYLHFKKVDANVITEGEGVFKVIKSRKVTDVQNFIFDVEKGKIVKEFSGKAAFWLGGKDKIIVERNGKIVFEGLPK